MPDIAAKEAAQLNNHIQIFDILTHSDIKTQFKQNGKPTD